jgi:uncharacterized delta-60 repeat protein
LAGNHYNGTNSDFAVVRYLSNGSLDTGFGDGGKVYTDIAGTDQAHAVSIQADGKIVVAGESSNDFAVVRYNTDGTLDGSFDGDGKVKTPILAGEDEAQSVAVQEDGRIVAGGSSYNGSNRDFALVRYNIDGGLDSTFGVDGKATTPVLSSWDDGYSVGIQPDGRIVMAGAAYNGSKYVFALVRFTPNGSVYTTLDGDGKVTTSITNQCDIASAMAIQPDGRIIVAGSSHSCGGGSDNDFVLVRYGETCRTASAPFDYDGDGKTDISVFRPQTGAWYLQRSRDGLIGAEFGFASDKLAPADYNGDGKTEVGVYRPETGIWYVFDIESGTTSYYVFGLAEDLPTPADYDGDGKADISVFRPSTGTWYRQNSSDGSLYAQQFGASEDKPVLGDYDGDGKADLSVFRPLTGAWYQVYSSDGSLHGEAFGFDTDITVQGDYDGDGKTDIAVYRPTNGFWYIRNSNGPVYTAFPFGLSDDIPAPGDFDGDGRSDLSVFRPSDGNWYRMNSSNGSFEAYPFGQPGDRPTMTAFRY